MAYKNKVFLNGEDVDITSGISDRFPTVGDGNTYGSEKEYLESGYEEGYQEDTYYEDSSHIEDHSEVFAVLDKPDDYLMNEFFNSAISDNPFDSNYSIVKENNTLSQTSINRVYKEPLPSMASVKAADWLIGISRDNSHGYNLFVKERRGNPDYCASTLITSAYRSTGVELLKNAYTALMYKDCIRHGFKDVTKLVNLRTGEGTIKGDIVLRPGYHVEMVVSRNGHHLGGARHDENGGKGGVSGDLTGTEISVREWWDCGWVYCLRYNGDVLLNPPTDKNKNLLSSLSQTVLGRTVKDDGKTTSKTTKVSGMGVVWNRAVRTGTSLSNLLFLDSLDKINKTITSDYHNGKPWKFSNKSSNLASTFDEAVSKNKRYLNTTLLYQWALKESGVIDASEGNFGFKQGLFYGSDKVKGSFDISSGSSKTLNECIKLGLLKPGDIACISNTNKIVVYAGNGDFYDGSTTYCVGTGEGAKYKKILGNQTSKKISGVARLKGSDNSSSDASTNEGETGGTESEDPTTDADGTENSSEDNKKSYITNVVVTYGWVGHNGLILESRRMEGMFTEYQVEFQGASTVLTLEGTVGGGSNGTFGTAGFSEYPAEVYGGKPSEIVKKICEEEGIEVGEIEETKPILDSLGNPKSFTRTMTDVKSFIQLNLCEEAKNLKGLSGFTVYYTDGKLNFVHQANSKVGTSVSGGGFISVSSDDTNKKDNNEKSSDNKENTVTITDPLDLNNEAQVQDPLDLNNLNIYGFVRLGKDKKADLVLIGDSRTVGMYHAVTGGSAGDSVLTKDSKNRAWSAKVGAGLSDLKGSSGLYKLTIDKGYIGKNTKVVILMGVNDLGNSGEYKKYITKTIKPEVEKLGGTVSFCSVNPVDDDKSLYAKNSTIRSFNEVMKTMLGVGYIDTYHDLVKQVKSGSGDGIHYYDSLYKTIFKAITNADSGGDSDSDAEKDKVSGDGNSASSVDNTPQKAEIIRYYEYYVGRPNNRVINFSPTIKTPSLGGSVDSTVSVDETRNEIISTIKEGNSGENTGLYVVMGKSSSTIQGLADSAKFLRDVSASSYRDVEATLEILGDVSVELNKCVYISVYTKYGLLHHTSGVYWITGIEDSISDGVFITTLTLKRYYDGTELNNTGGDGSSDSADSSNQDDEDSSGSDDDSGSTGNSVAEKAVNWGKDKVKEHEKKGNHPYSNNVRWGPSYDCSSFAISCYKTGAKIDTGDANDTSNMTVLLNYGFKDVTSSCNFSNCNGMQSGDILWWDGAGIGGHAAIYIGGNRIIHSTGHGVGLLNRDYYSSSFDHVYRYKGSSKKKKKSKKS